MSLALSIGNDTNQWRSNVQQESPTRHDAHCRQRPVIYVNVLHQRASTMCFSDVLPRVIPREQVLRDTWRADLLVGLERVQHLAVGETVILMTPLFIPVKTPCKGRGGRCSRMTELSPTANLHPRDRHERPARPVLPMAGGCECAGHTLASLRQ